MKTLKKFNIFISIIFLIFVFLFILFFTTEEEIIYKDISEKYSIAEILVEKDIEDSRIIFFSVGETKIGIANYIKLPIMNRFYRQEMYTLDNIEDHPKEIRDVFMGKWSGYVITATPESIKLDNIDKFYGIYWVLIELLILLVLLEWFIYLFIKRRAKQAY